MATFETIRPAPFGAVTFFRIVNFLDNLRMSVTEWNTKRLTRNSLNKLTVRELEDIGLTLGDINEFTAPGFRRF